jgi:hypothetical protein
MEMSNYMKIKDSRKHPPTFEHGVLRWPMKNIIKAILDES